MPEPGAILTATENHWARHCDSLAIGGYVPYKRNLDGFRDSSMDVLKGEVVLVVAVYTAACGDMYLEGLGTHGLATYEYDFRNELLGTGWTAL